MCDDEVQDKIYKFISDGVCRYRILRELKTGTEEKEKNIKVRRRDMGGKFFD